MYSLLEVHLGLLEVQQELLVLLGHRLLHVFAVVVVAVAVAIAVAVAVAVAVVVAVLLILLVVCCV